MGVFYAFIDDGDDYRRIAARKLPCFRSIDICSDCCRSSKFLVAVVAVVPLFRQSGIVEPAAGEIGAGRTRFVDSEGHGIADRCFLQLRIELYAAHFRHCGQLLCGFLQICVLVEGEEVPFVQTCGAGLLLASCVVGEEAFQRDDSQTTQDVVHGNKPRTGRAGAGLSHGAFNGFDRTVVEIDQKRSRRCIGRRIDDLGRLRLRRSTPPALSIPGSVVQPADSRNNANMSSFLLFINYDFGLLAKNVVCRSSGADFLRKHAADVSLKKGP